MNNNPQSHVETIAPVGAPVFTVLECTTSFPERHSRLLAAPLCHPSLPPDLSLTPLSVHPIHSLDLSTLLSIFSLAFSVPFPSLLGIMMPSLSAAAPSPLSSTVLTPAPRDSRPPVGLVDGLFPRLGRGRVLRAHAKRVSDLAFSPDGTLAVTAAADATVAVHSVLTGGTPKSIPVKKHGAGAVAFTHAPGVVVTAATTPVDDALRALDLHAAAYTQAYGGHTAGVTSMGVSPVDDALLSASLDGSVRLWDLRSPTARGVLRGLRGRPAVAFDAAGLVVGVAQSDATAAQSVRLYDVRKYEGGPFCTLVMRETAAEVGRLSFSADGKALLLTSVGGGGRLYDAFTGVFLDEVAVGGGGVPGSGTAPPPPLPGGAVPPAGGVPAEAEGLVMEASFTPDAAYVLAGTAGGEVVVWSVAGRREVARLGGHATAVGCVKVCWEDADVREQRGRRGPIDGVQVQLGHGGGGGGRSWTKGGGGCARAGGCYR